METTALRVGTGKPGPGRPKGVPNRTTIELREAILEAATTGETDGLVGYYRNLKATMPDKFADTMRALIPRDLKLDATFSITHAMLVAAAGDFDAEAVQAALDVMRKKRALKPAAVIDVARVEDGPQPAQLETETHDAE